MCRSEIPIYDTYRYVSNSYPFHFREWACTVQQTNWSRLSFMTSGSSTWRVNVGKNTLVCPATSVGVGISSHVGADQNRVVYVCVGDGL